MCFFLFFSSSSSSWSFYLPNFCSCIQHSRILFYRLFVIKHCISHVCFDHVRKGGGWVERVVHLVATSLRHTWYSLLLSLRVLLACFHFFSSTILFLFSLHVGNTAFVFLSSLLQRKRDAGFEARHVVVVLTRPVLVVAFSFPFLVLFGASGVSRADTRAYWFCFLWNRVVLGSTF